ncbi:TPA: hypothetical protein ACJG4C_002918 [Salmonella enterica subsp. diarizonae serovar 61:r:z53]
MERSNRIRVRETRDTLHGENTAKVIRYGLPDLWAVIRDSDGKKALLMVSVFGYMSNRDNRA